MGLFKGKDKLWNGVVLGALLGVAAAFIPEIQNWVMDLLGSISPSLELIAIPIATFAGLGALIGLLADKF